MSEILCNPIGYVSSPFKVRGDVPRRAELTEISVITVKEEYLPALVGLEQHEWAFIICWFDRSDRTVLQARRNESFPLAGVFANRSPDRPNPIALTLVKILKIEGSQITVKGLEALDGTPILDIKPFSEGIDTPNGTP